MDLYNTHLYRPLLLLITAIGTYKHHDTLICHGHGHGIQDPNGGWRIILTASGWLMVGGMMVALFDDYQPLP